MATPDRPDEGHIADTGMFRRFVAQEHEIEQREAAANAPRRWVLVGSAVVLLVVIAIGVWLLLR